MYSTGTAADSIKHFTMSKCANAYFARVCHGHSMLFNLSLEILDL